MCERYSWIEKEGRVIFLTADDVFRSRRGKELQKYTSRPDDWHGHSAIRWYYDFTGGSDKECTDFSRPLNFPSELRQAIVKGKMWGFGITMDMYPMLLKRSLHKYKKVKQRASAEYDKVEQPAFDEYEKVEQEAWAEYQKVGQKAFAKYHKVKQQAWAEYDKVTQPAWAEYEKVTQQAWRQIWADPNNRRRVWRSVT